MKSKEERRQAKRYPLEMGALASVEEVFHGSSPAGATVRDISSRGILFESGSSFDEDSPVCLLINFTEKLATDYSAKLLVRGRIVRSKTLFPHQPGQYAMEFTGRWKFVRQENSLSP